MAKLRSEEEEAKLRLREKEFETKMAYEDEIRRENEDIELKRIEVEHKLKVEQIEVQDNIKTSYRLHIKVPHFNESRYEMDSYLTTFETYASASKLCKEEVGIHLAILLTGSAREVYDGLLVEHRNNYDDLKVALLRKFDLTDEGYKRKFQNERPRENETLVMFVGKMARHLDGRFRLSKVEQTYETVIDFLMRDQLLSSCTKELYQDLCGKRLTDVRRMAVETDIYAKTRGDAVHVVNKASNERTNDIEARRLSETNHGSVRCHLCRRVGHLARHCQTRTRVNSSVNANSLRSSGSSDWRRPWERNANNNGHYRTGYQRQ